MRVPDPTHGLLASEPLDFLAAGPREGPDLRVLGADSTQRRSVHPRCISRSQGNEGCAWRHIFFPGKPAWIPAGIGWAQITDQYAGRPSGPSRQLHRADARGPWVWMRDWPVRPERFLHGQRRGRRRDGCSDPGMANFLVAGGEGADMDKLRELPECECQLWSLALALPRRLQGVGAEA